MYMVGCCVCFIGNSIVLYLLVPKGCIKLACVYSKKYVQFKRKINL